jgi:hypothetical protein
MRRRLARKEKNVEGEVVFMGSNGPIYGLKPGFGESCFDGHLPDAARRWTGEKEKPVAE